MKAKKAGKKGKAVETVETKKVVVYDAEPVAEATVEVVGVAADPLDPAARRGQRGLPMTTRDGLVELDLGPVANGEVTVNVFPRHLENGPVGPDVAADPNPPDRIYRAVSFTARLADGAVVEVLPPFAGG